jgi:CheY-like chemotaxis protein
VLGCLLSSAYGWTNALNDTISILIADDHPLIRKGLRLSVEDDPGLKVVAEAGDGETALSLIASLQPDIALLDIEMPKLDGLGVARETMKRGLKTQMIFLTLHANQDLFRSRHSCRSRRTALPEFRHYGAVVAGIRSGCGKRPGKAGQPYPYRTARDAPDRRG